MSKTEEISNFNAVCMREVKNSKILDQLKSSQIKLNDRVEIELSAEIELTLIKLRSQIAKKKKKQRYMKQVNMSLNIIIISIAMIFMSFTANILLPEPYNLILAVGFIIPIVYNIGRYWNYKIR